MSRFTDNRGHCLPAAPPDCFCRAVTKHAVGIYDIPTACSSNRYDNAYAGIARLLGSSITILHATENLSLNKSNLQKTSLVVLSPTAALSCPTVPCLLPSYPLVAAVLVHPKRRPRPSARDYSSPSLRTRT